MSLTQKTRRRMFGALCLGGAVVMLVTGETRPAPNTDQRWYLVYWAVCIVLAASAMVAAILDLGAVRREARQQQRDLLEKAFLEIEAKRKESGADNAPRASDRLRD